MVIVFCFVFYIIRTQDASLPTSSYTMETKIFFNVLKTQIVTFSDIFIEC